VRASDVSQGCSQGSKPKTGPLMAQKENFPKQKKYKYFTSQKVLSQKNQNRFSQKNTSHHRKYFTSKDFLSQQVFFTKII
jgi:hypothetical protein